MKVPQPELQGQVVSQMSGIASARLRSSTAELAKERSSSPFPSFLSFSFCLDLPVHSYLQTACMLHTKCSEAGLKLISDLASRCTVPALFVKIKNGDEKAGKEGIENLYLNFLLGGYGGLLWQHDKLKTSILS